MTSVSSSDIGWQSWSHAGKYNFLLRNRAPFFQKSNFPKLALRKKTPPIAGWCSWYAFGTNISERIILDQLAFIVKHRFPLKYILIDDGWTNWGDWSTPDSHKFPRGMRALSKHIAQHGLKPGLWIAPFLVHSQTKIFHQHPDWFVRTRRGNLVEGTKVSLFDPLVPRRRWILDMQKPPVRSYIKQAIRRIVEQWGFTYLKLDFLYAQHFNPIFHSFEEPDNLLRDFLAWIKNSYPHVYLNVSGCPLVPAAGVVDAMRISADIVAPELRYIWPVNRVYATQALKQLQHNITKRMHTKRYWHLDPDVFVCHPKYGLSEAQISLLRSLIMKSDGLIFLGDNLLELDDALLRHHILPLLSTIH